METYGNKTDKKGCIKQKVKVDMVAVFCIKIKQETKSIIVKQIQQQSKLALLTEYLFYSFSLNYLIECCT